MFLKHTWYFETALKLNWNTFETFLKHPLNFFNPSWSKHHPLSENRDFSTSEHPIDLRPVCKFKFVCYGPVEKNQSALSASI